MRLLSPKTPLLNKLMRDLLQKKLLFLSVGLLLIIAISMYVGMGGVYQDLNGARIKYYNHYHLADFMVDVESVNSDVLQRLEQEPNIKAISGRVVTSATVDIHLDQAHLFDDDQPSIPGIAMSYPTKPPAQINDVMPYQGGTFSHPYAHEVLLVEKFATSNHVRVGDTIRVHLIDGPHDLLVVGIVNSPEYIFVTAPGSALAPDDGGYAVMFMPLGFLQKHMDIGQAYNQVLGLVDDHDPTVLKNTLDHIAALLAPFGLKSKQVQLDIMSVRALHDELEGVRVSTTAIPPVFLILAALIVNIMMRRLIMQQRTTIGLFKALGMSNSKIMAHYLSYGLIIGLVGGLLGCLLGLWMQSGMVVLYKTFFAIPNITFMPHADVMIIGIAIGLFTALMGALFGSIAAIRLQPAEAMKPESPALSFKKRRLATPSWFKKLNFSNKLVLRNMRRNPLRSSVTVLSMSVATGLLLGTIAMLDGVFYMVNYEYDHVQQQDYTITLRHPVSGQVMSSINALPNIKDSEPYLNIPALFRHGPYEKKVGIQGIPAHHTLFTPLDDRGEAIVIPKEGIVLSRALATILQVNIGDTIQVTPLIGARNPLSVSVQNIVPTYMGLSSYADLFWLSRTLGADFLISSVGILGQDPAKMGELTRILKGYNTVINFQSKDRAKQLFANLMDQFMTSFLVVIVLFSGAVAITTILNNIIISMSERAREVATFSVLGMSNREIFSLFFKESVLLNAVGLIFGIALGIYLNHLMSEAFSTEIFRFPVVIEMSRIAQTMGCVLLFLLIAYTYIYRVVSKTHWLALLNERE